MREPNPELLLALLLDSLLTEPGLGDGDGASATRRLPNRPRPSLREDILAATGPIGAGALRGFRERFRRLFALDERGADSVLGELSHPDGESWLQLGAVSYLDFPPGPALPEHHGGLVRCRPGGPFPTHRHLGTETTLMLAGAIRDDDDGSLILPGDIVRRPAGSVHNLYVLPPCDCIFAVLLEGDYPDFM